MLHQQELFEAALKAAKASSYPPLLPKIEPGIEADQKIKPETDIDNLPDFSKKEEVLSKKERKKLKEETAGAGWFNLKAPRMTAELERDLKIIKMRGAIDPKRHYRKDDSKELPKYFQMGTIIEGPTEFYSSRLTRKERKQTILEELMQDDKRKKYLKRKYLEIDVKKQSGGRGYAKKIKERRRPKWLIK